MPKKLPVTMLSGFLGAGKTTFLRYLLENSKEKVACIVNDVASVNIDAKLVRNDRNRTDPKGQTSTADLTDTIELANGCACCSIKDELFASFEQVLALAEKRGTPYDRIVLENSGVAEPQNIRDRFAESEGEGHPLLDSIELDSLVTVVDCSAFMSQYATRQALAQRPDLGSGGALRPVVDLLVEQIECADVVLCNKSDLIETSKLEELLALIGTLNPLARVVACEQGKLDLDLVLHSNSHVARLNIEGHHRGAVAAVAAAEKAAAAAQAKADKVKDEEHHHHDHDHDCKDKDCHAHHCHEKDCKHSSHDHHQHQHEEHCNDENCKDPSHCHNKDCQDPSHQHHHGHSHSHSHSKEDNRQETTAAARFGIRSFVYLRRRPFHPMRLKTLVLRWLPVALNRSLDAGEKAPEGDSPLHAVLRSKGFTWLASSHTTANYWSHAGGFFEIRDEGDWWSAIEEESWPAEADRRNTILEDFDFDEVSGGGGEFGDRRQEIVFIGINMDQKKIEDLMDAALLTDVELGAYRERWAEEADPEHPEVEERKAAFAKAKAEEAERKRKQEEEAAEKEKKEKENMGKCCKGEGEHHHHNHHHHHHHHKHDDHKQDEHEHVEEEGKETA